MFWWSFIGYRKTVNMLTMLGLGMYSFKLINLRLCHISQHNVATKMIYFPALLKFVFLSKIKQLSTSNYSLGFSNKILKVNQWEVGSQFWFYSYSKDPALLWRTGPKGWVRRGAVWHGKSAPCWRLGLLLVWSVGCDLFV